jgi:hypothetical protein
VTDEAHWIRHALGHVASGPLGKAIHDTTEVTVSALTEEPSAGCDGERYATTPDLGVFRSAMSANGDVLVQEDRLRAVLSEAADAPSLQHAVRRLLGAPWDDELEPYRCSGDGTPVRWLSAAV